MCPEKTLGIRLRSTNFSPRAKPRTRSRVVEVGGAIDDRYVNVIKNRTGLSLLNSAFDVTDQKTIW